MWWLRRVWPGPKTSGLSASCCSHPSLWEKGSPGKSPLVLTGCGPKPKPFGLHCRARALLQRQRLFPSPPLAYLDLGGGRRSRATPVPPEEHAADWVTDSLPQAAPSGSSASEPRPLLGWPLASDEVRWWHEGLALSTRGRPPVVGNQWPPGSARRSHGCSDPTLPSPCTPFLIGVTLLCKPVAL